MAPWTDAMTRATTIAKYLEQDSRIVGVCLVGSQARLDPSHNSDVDLLVLTSRPLAVGELRSQIEDARLWFPTLSLLPQTASAFHDAASRGSLFVLHASKEGEILFDRNNTLRAAFQAVRGVPPDVDGEIRRRMRPLRHYEDLSRFNGNLLFALAAMYGSGKGIAIALTAQMGCLTFVKDEALARVANRLPELRSDIDTIRELRPFYDLVREQTTVGDLPFDYHHAERHVERAAAAVANLAGVASHGD
jgi:hypothetical protein